MTVTRLDEGGLIDRDKNLRFSWDGRSYQGFQGYTLASALMANGETVLARSFKYHRPRGIMSAGVEESGALVMVGNHAYSDPNVKATTQELYDGLIATGQNAWPSVRCDLGAVSNFFSRFLSAGFYYKTFMGLPPFEWGRGTGIWMQYEKLIRKSAGMGRMSRDFDPDTYEHSHAYCAVLVVGAGIAGIHAALSAAHSGLDVLLVEQDSELGGDLLHQGNTQKQRTEILLTLQKSDVRVLSRTTAFGLYDHGIAGLLERVTDHLPNTNVRDGLPRQRHWTVRCEQIILACGALERSFAFGHNDRPGILTASAARAYLHRYALLIGRSIVVSTTNDSAYQTAFDLSQKGASVTLLDSRTKPSADLRARAQALGIEVMAGTAPMQASGYKVITGIEIARRNCNGWSACGKLDCDSLLVSGGWSPVVHLHSHRGVKPIWNQANKCFLPGIGKEPIAVVGSAAGYWQIDECLQSGVSAGEMAAKSLGKRSQAQTMPARKPNASIVDAVYEIRVKDRQLKSFVDPQHDVTTADIRLAHQEGFVSVEHLKRYTTLGMATDQGKMSNIIGLALMAEALGKDIPSVGTTTFRPPYTPVSLGALAGRSVKAHFKPLRRTPFHQWNLDKGATMTDAGLWHRSWYFARAREGITEAYIRKSATVRKTVGICDVTSLGKISVQGPDSTEFLNRIYTNAFAKLPIGKSRYGIMLRDDGIVMDDGTAWRLSENDYLVTTTTGNAGKVIVWMEELLQIRWSNLKVHVTSVTEQWAGLSVAGPKSRETIQACLAEPEQLTNQACPFMAVIETKLLTGLTCRIARISFSGEMAYEIYVPSDYATHLAEMLYAEVEKHDGCLYGLEALGTLRIEKGHVTVAELDGRTTIDDAGLGKMASENKSYIGSVLRQREAMKDDNRPRLVGIFPRDRNKTFNAGTVLCAGDNVSGLGEGWVTGATYSPALGHWIGIGFIRGGYQAWSKQYVVVADPVRQAQLDVEIVSPHMFDPSGERMHG